MFWLAPFVLLILVAIAAIGAAISLKDKPRKTTSALVAAGAILLALILTVVSSVHNVDTQEVGVIRSFGKIDGQTGHGIVITPPWSDVQKWSISNQTIEPTTSCANGKPRCMTAGSVDIQDVYVQADINISVSPKDIQDLAAQVGPNYRDSIVEARLNQVVKEVISGYKAEDILKNREKIRGQIRTLITTELQPFSISVTGAQVVDIDFTKGFKDAVEEKVIASQKAQTEFNNIEVEKNKASQEEQKGIAAGNFGYQKALLDAKANDALQASLTPNLLQYLAIQKFGDKVQIALVPSGEGNLLDPSTFLKQGLSTTPAAPTPRPSTP